MLQHSSDLPKDRTGVERTARTLVGETKASSTGQVFLQASGGKHLDLCPVKSEKAVMAGTAALGG